MSELGSAKLGRKVSGVMGFAKPWAPANHRPTPATPNVMSTLMMAPPFMIQSASETGEKAPSVTPQTKASSKRMRPHRGSSTPQTLRSTLG